MFAIGRLAYNLHWNWHKGLLKRKGRCRMRTLIVTAFLVLGFAHTGSPLFAQTADGVTPAGESVCDPLLADGVTKGLYGLCIAYCEAETQSQDVLDSYNIRKTDADPAMPCGCPCWSSIEVIEGALRLCGTTGQGGNEEVGFLFLEPEFFLEIYGVSIDQDSGTTQCAHILDFVDVEREPVDSSQEEACRADLHSVCPPPPDAP